MLPTRMKAAAHKVAFITLFLVALVGSTAIADENSHSSVTGYFGLDDDGLPIVDRHGIMLVFDGEIAPETVSVDTFEVSLNDGSFAEVVETRVEERYVFLRLRSELASDATPIVGIAEGEEVEDLAGNSTNTRKFGFVQVADGISPRLTVTLSGGSGLGTGDEGPDRLTNDSIDIHITSDEPLQGAPRVVVVCEGLSWAERDKSSEIERDIEDFIANRNGPFSQRPQEPPGATYTCGYGADEDGIDDGFELTEDVANSRPGEVWELTWRNPTGSMTSLRDGELAVVVYGRDRSRYERFGETVSNWSASNGDFRLDTRFGFGALLEQVKIHPPDGSVIRERHPFVLLEFPESTTVFLDSVVLDGIEIANEFEEISANEFVYWPLSMNRGRHDVDVEATDAAGNTVDFGFKFETARRGDFVVGLQPGWNAVSFPADPVDAGIASVFDQPSVEVVIAWDGSQFARPWAIAVRRGGRWEQSATYNALTQIVAGRGYWVKSTGFTKQAVQLARRARISEINRNPGWNFVGVTDLSGSQTEDHFGKDLLDEDGNPVYASEYLGGFEAAFTWDPIDGRFESVSQSETLTVGDGVWVYY